jgi:integrase
VCKVRQKGRAWTAAAGLTDGPLLRSVDRAGRVGHGRMATSSVYRLLRRAGARAGIDLTRLSPHSLRRGHITTAATTGASEREIARTSRHASLVVLRGYIDDAEPFRDPSSSHLGL